ncbi:MAG: gliding motility-associated C-terminal domain-containing protein [Bacteroidia bacterium]
MKHKAFTLFIILVLGFCKYSIANFPQIGNGLPLHQNNGQFDKNILYRSQAKCFDLHVGSNSLHYYFYNKKQWNRAVTHPAKGEKLDSIDVHGIGFEFLNSNKNTQILGIDELPYKQHFFIGKNPKNWATNVKSFYGVEYKNLYNGISMKFNTKNEFKYEFFIEPNANANDIQIAIIGAEKLSIEYGDLFIETPIETIRESKPIAFQYINGKKIDVKVEFKLKGNVLSYFLPNGYDKNHLLVIDPKLVFLTYSGSTVDNFGFTATPGENGTLYSGGIATGPYSVNPAGKYPTQLGSFRQFFAGGRDDRLTEVEDFPCDITISKYSSDGTTLLWSTYIGGTNANEYPHSLFVDSDSNLVVLGTTSSNDFPVTTNVFDTTYNGSMDIVVFKFNFDGTVLIGSTYLGGMFNDGVNYNGVTNYFYADGFRGDVTCNFNNKIYIASVTNSPDFPTTAGAYSQSLSGVQDGVVFCLNQDLTNLEWSTYFGGDGNEGLYSIDFGLDNNIYLAGGTSSTDLPGASLGLQKTYNGGRADGFISVISADGQQVLRSTYWGTSNYDQAFSLELDEDQNVYIVGHSTGSMPVKGNVYKTTNGRQFISCFNNSLTENKWSTVFGGGRGSIDLTINAFLVDECRRIYVTGWGGNTSSRGNTLNSSTRNLAVTTDAFQQTTDGSDFYLMVLNRDAVSLMYASFLGGNQNSGDHVDGGTSRFDKKGVVYQSMCASCPDGTPPFPLSDLNTTPNSFAPVNISPRCSNAALKFDFRIENAAFDFDVDTCSGVFTFKNTTQDAFTFYWIFPDGDTSTQENPKKYIHPKYYGDTITLIVEFGTNCADTAYGTVSLPDTLMNVEIPNVFTPNGDGINDYFMIKGANGQCDKAEAFIYNRWGQLYFKSDSPNFKWDGKSNDGIEAPEGVYFLILNVEKNNGKVINHRSTITLMR